MPAKKYGRFSTDTEYLSDDELMQITKMACAQDIFFRIFTCEDAFIKYVLYEKTNLNRLIVYNSAQSGTGAGRKSLIPAICQYYHIRYTGSDSYRVSLCRDKWAISTLLKNLSIPTPNSILFYCGKPLSFVDPDTKYIAKPIHESASIGIRSENIFFGRDIPIKYLIKLEKTMQQPLILQEFISGYELEVPVLASRKEIYAFKPVSLYQIEQSQMMGDQILDYDRIYNDDYSFGSLPPDIRDDDIKETACTIAKVLQLSGLCRIDFRLRANGEFYITDVSTNPHFIQHSSVNYAFRRVGLHDKDIFHTILALS